MATREEWKKLALPNFGGYDVSTLGRVRSYWTRTGGVDRKAEPHILKPSLDVASGRHFLTLSTTSGKTRNLSVAKLVAVTFHGKPKAGQVVLFKDRDKANCRASNLAWGSRSEAAEQRTEDGTSKAKNRLNPKAIVRIAKGKGGKLKASEWAAKEGCTKAAVWNIWNGVSHSELTGLTREPATA